MQAAFAARQRGAGALAPSDASVAGPMSGTETRREIAQELMLDNELDAGVMPAAANTFSLYTNKYLKPYTAVPPLSSSDVNEPAHANSGKYVFYTGNWYAARSSSQGGTWTYINPYADFPDFCCDQDVVYDGRRDMLIWYRQGVQLAGGNNNIKISTSLNGGINWATWTISFGSFAGLPLGWFDYPHLAVTKNYLYITTNYFNPNGTFQRMILMKWPLDQLQAQAGLGGTWWSRTTGYSWTPVQGARDVMYGGDHTSTTVFNVCKQNEADSALPCVDVSVPAWTATPREGAVCTVPNGFNPCKRLDQRITGGWLREDKNTTRHVVGFFWTVQQGAGFPFPYVNAATFDAQTLAYLGRPAIWSNAGAWVYGGAAPNRYGALGIGAYFIGGGTYPQLYAGIDDDYNADPPGWSLALVRGSNWAVNNRWGDYLRVREHGPEGYSWSISGHTTQAATSTAPLRQEPQYATFGRGRDRDGYDRFRTK
jgi:hypothetical protein